MDKEVPELLTGPSVTYAEVEAAIRHETYTVLPNGRTTVCQLTLDNGFTVEGESACVSLANFDAVKGNLYARNRAIDEVWKLLGFRLADKLAAVLAVDVSVAEEVGPTKPIELGDQVHYYEQINGNVTEPMLALVTSVLGFDHVSLTVFAPNGTQHARQNVVLVYPGVTSPEVPFFARLK